jgi:hypothetical protein
VSQSARACGLSAVVEPEVSAAIRIVARPSLSLAAILLAAHLAAAAVVWMLSAPVLVAILMSLVIAASAVWTFAEHVLRIGRRAVTVAIWSADGAWQLFGVSGELAKTTLRPDSYVSLRLVVLNFASPPLGCRSLVLFSDSLDAEVFRRLRLRLRESRDVGADSILPFRFGKTERRTGGGWLGP